MVRELEREDRIVSFRLTIPDRPGVLGQIATRLGRARRQHPGGRSPPAVSRRAGQGRQARRHGRDPRPRPCRGDHAGARSRRLCAGADRDRDRDGVIGGLSPRRRIRDMIRCDRNLESTLWERVGGWRRAVREKELRIALVCFGGVSLAVYMHGITKEILKLVRASSALHAIPDRAVRARARRTPTASSARRSRLRHRAGLFRAAARDRPQRRAARDRRHHRRRLRRRHQRHHAGARAGARPADGGAARPVARQRRRHRSCWRPTRAPAPGANGSCGRSSGAPPSPASSAAVPGPRGAPQAVAVRALALVQAAARRPRDGGADVRRGDADGAARSRAARRCCRPATRSTCSSR